MTSPARKLSTAEDRRETVLEAAMKVVAARGIHATPTAEVAKAAGISHAYLFRLFATKNDLAVAVVQRANRRIYDAFAAAAADARKRGEEPLEAMGKEYSALLADRDLLLVQMHAHAAAPDNGAVREVAREGFARLVELVETESGADRQTIGRFFATGMLMNVMAAVGAFEAAGDGAHWAELLTSFCIEDEQA